MTFTDIREAQLFRILGGFFGPDRVVPLMSVMAVCGGALPESLPDPKGEIHSWARSNRCLFTIVDYEDHPKMVIEFFSGIGDVIDPIELDHMRYLQQILPAAGIRYVTMSSEEFSDLLDPRGNLDLCALLEEKVGL